MLSGLFPCRHFALFRKVGLGRLPVSNLVFGDPSPRGQGLGRSPRWGTKVVGGDSAFVLSYIPGQGYLGTLICVGCSRRGNLFFSPMSSRHITPPLPFVEVDSMVIEDAAVTQPQQDVEMTQDDANANVSKASGDVEMNQDGANANVSTSRIVHVDTTALTEEQIKVVMEDSIELYPEEYADHFGLRGSDRPSSKPGEMKSARHLKCNAGFL